MSYFYNTEIGIKATAVSASQTNFPVALVVTDSRFATAANGGHIQNTATGGASGSLTVPADFVVSPNDDGSSPYDFEIVDYDPTTGYIELWVEITSLSSTEDTTIYLVYGDSAVTTSQENVSGTWESNFKGVWHLGETGSAVYDSTAGGYDGTFEGEVTKGSTGKVGDCVELPGSSDFVDLPDLDSPTECSSNLTIEAWASWTSITGQQPVFADGGYVRGWEFGLYNGNLHVGIMNGDTSLGHGYAASLTASQLHHIVAVIDGPNGDIDIYLDGSLGSSDHTLSTFTDFDGTFGARFGSTRRAEDTTCQSPSADNSTCYDLTGKIDEVRWSCGSRDADWIAISYNNQNDPTPGSTFWTEISSEVSRKPLVELRPVSDAYVGNWTTDAEGTTNLYQAIDEETADDNDYVQSEENPSSSVYVAKLSSGREPVPIYDDWYTLSYRYMRIGGRVVNLTVELRQGYVNESTLGTLIASFSHEDIIEVEAVQATQFLTEQQVSNITDYADLYIRFVATEA